MLPSYQKISQYLFPVSTVALLLTVLSPFYLPEPNFEVPAEMVAGPGGLVRLTSDKDVDWEPSANILVLFEDDRTFVGLATGGDATVLSSRSWTPHKVRQTKIRSNLPPGPGPEPGPTPPPPPTPDVPIPEAGFRVLIVYESADLSSLPPGQLASLYARQVREYLDTKCVTGPDGKTKEWRLWDQNADASGESQLWQKALSRKRASVPWVVISDGTKGFEGPLPQSLDETMNLLKKYGG